MVKEFDQYWAVILGGSSGLGLATAKKLASHGMNICIIHRDSRAESDAIDKEFQSITELGIQFCSFNIDAINSEKISETITQLKSVISPGTLRCLVHSLAKGSLKAMAGDKSSLTSDDFMLTIDAMAITLYKWTMALHQAGLFAGDARVISFTSEGSSKAWRNYAAVSAAKASLESISRSIALEMAPFGIRSNCIQAGVTDTKSLRMIPGSEVIIALSQKRNPNKRLTKPDDIADVAYLLCKEEAKWITGSIVKADGGESLS